MPWYILLLCEIIRSMCTILFWQVIDATFDHILPLAQSRIPASFGMEISRCQIYIQVTLGSTGNIAETVITDCMELNIAEQLC